MAQCGKCGKDYPSWGNCKPCRNERLQKQRQNNHTCKDCSVIFNRPHGGKASRCGQCYPIFRQAYVLLHSCKYRAKTKGFEFDLDIDWILSRIRSRCPMVGDPFVFGQGTDYSNRHPMTPSIDKINPERGYTKDNCRVVSWFYNSAKQRWADREVIELCRKIAKQ